MKTMNQQRGISLIEVMVALAIGLFIILLVTVVYLTGGRHLNFRQGQGENLANSRYTLDTLSTQLVKAGYRRDPLEKWNKAFPRDSYLGCDFAAKEVVQLLADGALCIRYQQRDEDEKNCSGTHGDIRDLNPYENLKKLEGKEEKGMYFEKYWVTPDHRLVCNEEDNTIADGVQSIHFEFGIGPPLSPTDEDEDHKRRVDEYTTDPGNQPIRSLRYAILLATSNERVSGGIESDVCARWIAAGGDGNLCDTSSGRVYQLVGSALTLRNLMP